MDHHGTFLTSQQNCKGCDYEHPGTLCESPLVRMKTGALLNGSCNTSDKPPIVCLCGSTRFGEAFRTANLAETLAGKIVLSVGCYMRSDAEIFADKSPDELEQVKTMLDELHLRKINMADEVMILNVGGYIGESTRRELDHALKFGKKVRYLESV